MCTPENGWPETTVGIAQFDDIIGSVMRYLLTEGLNGDIIVVSSTDTGCGDFHQAAQTVQIH